MKRILSIVLTLALLLTALPLALGVSAAETEITFNLGANGSASHTDGSSKTTYAETVDGYKLTLSNVTNFYTGARDAKGNGCIKLGASSKTGGFSFTVPSEVTSVIISVAGYKNNTVSVKVNNTTTAIKTTSNNGAYTDLSIDTSTTKTVTLITTTGYRAMVNTITFVIPSDDSGCEHEYEETAREDATCTENGSITYTCKLGCGDFYVEPIIASGHDYEEISREDASCTKTGSVTTECTECGDDVVKKLPKLQHTYTDGKCSVCQTPNAVFEFGANKNVVEHTESTTAITAYTETKNGQTLTLTVTADDKVYKDNWDAIGNSCLKLGTKSVAGKFSFVVPENVDEVIISASGYKETIAYLTINGTTYNTDKAYSNNGEYVDFTIDTSTNKTVTVTTTSSGYRAMINSITFVVNENAEEECTHANEEDGEVITEATYFKEGLKEIVCADCGEFIRNEAIACDTAAPVVYTYSYDAAANALTINWTYSKAFEMDMLNATEVMFNFELAGYSKDVAINDAQLGGTVTLTGFNAERVSETLYIGLNVKISDVANTSKFDEAAVKELKVADIANDEKLDTLLEALEADAVVDGKAENTQWLVSNIAKLDLKAAKAELNVAASQELIDALAAKGGRTDRAVKLIVKIGDDFTKEFEINDLRKYTIVTISGLSFEQLNGDISVQLVFDYANNEYDFATDEIVFACGDMIADADTAAANAFVAYMN